MRSARSLGIPITPSQVKEVRRLYSACERTEKLPRRPMDPRIDPRFPSPFGWEDLGLNGCIHIVVRGTSGFRGRQRSLRPGFELVGGAVRHRDPHDRERGASPG